MAAQSFIGFMVGYFPHSAPQASQDFAHAAQIAAAVGPWRAQILAARAQICPLSSDSAFVRVCSFMPEAIIEAQCREQARHASAQVEQAFAQRE